MMFKENNGNAFIMKCFQVMSSDNLNSTSRSLITGFPWKMLYDWPLKVGLALLYPPLLVMDNLWRMRTKSYGWRHVLLYDLENPWHCRECWIPSTVVLEASQNKYRLIRYGLPIMLWTTILCYWSWKNDFV